MKSIGTIGTLIKKHLFLALSILLIAMSLSCTHHEIDTWEEWCEQITGVDLEKKYNKWGGIFSVSYNVESIRKDFVEAYNDVVVTYVADKYLGGAEKDDKVVLELFRLKMIGVWYEDTHLHIANSLMMKDRELGVNEFKDYIENFTDMLDLEKSRDKLDEFQYCLFGTINSVFENVILHGPEESDVATIPVEYTLKEYEQKQKGK